MFEIFKIFIIIILLIYELYIYFPFLKKIFIWFKIYISTKYFHKILIEFDISAINSKYGPGNFIRAVNQVLPFNWGKCCFISSKHIKKYFYPDFFLIPRPFLNQRQLIEFIRLKIIDKFILGPIFVPKKWNDFPNKKIWKERKFKDLLNLTKGIAVHSKRVKDYLMEKTNTFKLEHKFIIIRPCTNLKPIKIKSFIERKIDLLFFEKYADLNRMEQGKELLNLFKNTSKNIVTIKYGSYNKKIINELASDSKFIIYFSFFDTGAIGLKEIQNHGVICFTHQKEFVIDNESSFYISELASINNIKLAFDKIMIIMERISKLNIKSEIIAKKNQNFNRCENSLIDICKSLS